MSAYGAHHVPKYIVRPSPERLLIDRFLVLVFLGILLYVGVFINYYIVSASLNAGIEFLIVAGIIILMSLELVLCYVKYGKYSYEFYDDKIEFKDQKQQDVAYNNIASISYHHNILDKWVHTGSIKLKLSNGHTVKIRYLDNPNQALVYLQKHVKHARDHQHGGALQL